MFQGLGTNIKKWNEYTESHFLDRLNELGSVYTYQDKINNIWHYSKNKTNKNYNINYNDYDDYDDDIDIDLSYIRINTHIKIVYNDIMKKYKNIDDYILIPIGFSLGGYMALYFSQCYKHLCKHVIMLDTSGFIPYNVKQKLEEYEKLDYIKNITNAKYKIMLDKLKSNIDDAYISTVLTNVHIYIRLRSALKYLHLDLLIPTISFINIQTTYKNENEKIENYLNNKVKLEEIEMLKTRNPTLFTSIIFTNKTHYIYNQIQPAKQIIKYIQKIIMT